MYYTNTDCGYLATLPAGHWPETGVGGPTWTQATPSRQVAQYCFPASTSAWVQSVGVLPGTAGASDLKQLRKHKKFKAYHDCNSIIWITINHLSFLCDKLIWQAINLALLQFNNVKIISNEQILVRQTFCYFLENKYIYIYFYKKYFCEIFHFILANDIVVTSLNLIWFIIKLF